jgi:hypothetical protein
MTKRNKINDGRYLGSSTVSALKFLVAIPTSMFSKYQVNKNFREINTLRGHPPTKLSSLHRKYRQLLKIHKKRNNVKNLLIYITPVCRSYYNSLIHDPTGEKDH